MRCVGSGLATLLVVVVLLALVTEEVPLPCSVRPSAPALPADLRRAGRRRQRAMARPLHVRHLGRLHLLHRAQAVACRPHHIRRRHTS